MRLLEEVPLPTVSLTQRVRFAMRCAVAVYNNAAYHRWAQDWLSGEARSAAAAWAAADADRPGTLPLQSYAEWAISDAFRRKEII
jgi:hypothetical protein